MISLTEEDVLAIHDELIRLCGGTAGILHPHALKAAVHNPGHTFGGEELYPTLEEKAAVLGYTLILNHPFIDGNKRTGMAAMLTMLEVNGLSFEIENDKLVELAVEIANRKITLAELTDRLKQRT